MNICSGLTLKKSTPRRKIFINLDLIEKEYYNQYINYNLKDLDIVIENLKKDLENNFGK